MKYSNEEIQNKFSNTDFDPNGIRQQRVLAKIYAKSQERRFGMKKYYYLAAIAVTVFTAIIILPFGPNAKHAGPHYSATQDAAYDPAANIKQAAQEYNTQAAAAQYKAPEKYREPLSLVSRSSPGVSGLAEYSYDAVPFSFNNMNTEEYLTLDTNTFKSAQSDPLSTFSADVDTASYNIVKQMISRGQNPEPNAVRAEEFINYFAYNYPAPQGNAPVKITTELTDYPWNKEHKLLKIGVKAKEIESKNLPPSNLVFLIDVSGSMERPNGLPLVKKSLKMLIDNLRPKDTISIVTYADGEKVALDGASAKDKAKIIKALDGLSAGGGTNGESGLKMAYEVAKKHFKKNGNNRIILATDGDFNIGESSPYGLEKQITGYKESGVFLSVFGFGMGNYKDTTVQTLANKGNGNAGYIDNLFEAKKYFVTEFAGTLFTVAKDVKFQVEFNPALVDSYRLIGYEKRKLNNEDFDNDKKDAGEMGAGHTVTVLYEIVPADGAAQKLKYSAPTNDKPSELATIKMRYKDPKKNTSELISQIVEAESYIPFDNASDDTRFAAAAAAFAEIAKGTESGQKIDIDAALQQARLAKGTDEEGYRADFIKTANLYKSLPKEILFPKLK